MLDELNNQEFADGKKTSLNTGSIVVVEDDPSLVRFWQRLLKTHTDGPSMIFSHPLMAMKWIQQNNVSLLITDLAMPGVDGTQVITCALRQNPLTKIILTTGFVPEPNNFDQLGAHINLVPKPYTNMNHLTSLIKILLDESMPACHEKISVWNI